MARRPPDGGRSLSARAFVAKLTRLVGRRLVARWVATLRRAGRLPRAYDRRSTSRVSDADADSKHKEM